MRRLYLMDLYPDEPRLSGSSYSASFECNIEQSTIMS